MQKRGIFVIHEGDTTEIQWSDREPTYGIIAGYLQIHEDGALTVPFRDADDNPFVFVLDCEGGKIVASEDMPPKDGEVVWPAGLMAR